MNETETEPRLRGNFPGKFRGSLDAEYAQANQAGHDNRGPLARTNYGRTIPGTRERKPAPQVAQKLDGGPGTVDNPVWTQLAPWQGMPWFAKRFQTPPPPYSTVIAAGATVTIVNFLTGNQRAAVIESIDITMQSPIGLPAVIFNILRNGIPIPEVGDSFTVDHPFDTVVARDIRLYDGDRLTITAFNSGIAAFTSFVRVVGYDFSMSDVGDISWFYQGS